LISPARWSVVAGYSGDVSMALAITGLEVMPTDLVRRAAAGDAVILTSQGYVEVRFMLICAKPRSER